MKHDPRSGQSLIDVLIASGVGAILLVGALAVLSPALRGSTDAQYAQTGATLARGLQDSLRSYSASNWNALAALPQGTANRYHLGVTASGTYELATGTELIGDVTANLVGHWKLDEATPATAANAVPGGAAGTSVGTPVATSTCARAGCWSFAGSSRVDLGNAAALQRTSGTISAWINTTGAGGSFRGILAKQYAYSMFLNNGEFGMYDWSATWRGSGVTINDGAWHHVACSFQSGVTNGTRCYVDGDLVMTTTITVTNQSATLQVGDANAGQFFNGLIDDARLYSSVLTATEIRTLSAAATLDGTYERSFFLEPVRRTSGGAITPSGGFVDPSTLQAVIEYRWPRGTARTIATYLTRSQSRAMVQDDWTGGPGVTTPVTVPGNQFDTSSGISFDSDLGSVTLQLP